MFIKLTSWERDSDHGESIYLNPLTITGMWANGSCTHVNTVDGGWYVVETPEEIMSQVESVIKYYLRLSKTLVF